MLGGTLLWLCQLWIRGQPGDFGYPACSWAAFCTEWWCVCEWVEWQPDRGGKRCRDLSYAEGKGSRLGWNIDWDVEVGWCSLSAGWRLSRTTCDNYCGIALLSIPSKIFSRAILNRLKPCAELFHRKNQWGFCQGRGCADQFFLWGPDGESKGVPQANLHLLHWPQKDLWFCELQFSLDCVAAFLRHPHQTYFHHSCFTWTFSGSYQVLWEDFRWVCLHKWCLSGLCTGPHTL